MITFEEFKKLEIKVAKIKEVKDHPNADKLYVIIIDLGDKTIIISNNENDKNSVENMAELAQTIPYEILVHIPPHLRRIVV